MGLRIVSNQSEQEIGRQPSIKQLKWARRTDLRPSVRVILRPLGRFTPGPERKGPAVYS